MDPSVCDACLHLSAVPYGPLDSPQGIPVACEAILPPKYSQARMPQAHAHCVPGVMGVTQSQSSIRISGLSTHSIGQGPLPQTPISTSQVKL